MTTPPCIGPEFTAGPLAAPDKPWTTLQIKNAQPMAWPYDPTALPAGNGLGSDPTQGLWVDAAALTDCPTNTITLTYTSGTDPANMNTASGVDNVLRSLDFTWTNPLCEPQQLLVSTRFEVYGYGLPLGQMVSLKAEAGDASWSGMPAPAAYQQLADQYGWETFQRLANWSLAGRIVRRIVAPANATVTIVRRIAVNLTIFPTGQTSAPSWPQQWKATSKFMAMPSASPQRDGW